MRTLNLAILTFSPPVIAYAYPAWKKSDVAHLTFNDWLWSGEVDNVPDRVASLWLWENRYRAASDTLYPYRTLPLFTMFHPHHGYQSNHAAFAMIALRRTVPLPIVAQLRDAAAQNRLPLLEPASGRGGPVTADTLDMCYVVHSLRALGYNFVAIAHGIGTSNALVHYHADKKCLCPSRPPTAPPFPPYSTAYFHTASPHPTVTSSLKKKSQSVQLPVG